MPKKKLQFLVTEDIFNQFEAIRRSRFSSTAKQTLLYSIFSEWLSYQQRGSRVWEHLKNGETAIPTFAPILQSTPPERICVASTKAKNTRTATSLMCGSCSTKVVQRVWSSLWVYPSCWASVTPANISSPKQWKANYPHSLTNIFSFVTEMTDEDSPWNQIR